MSTSHSPSFGTLLKQYRRNARLTQEVLAQQSGYSVSYIGKLERGSRHPISSTAEYLSQFLFLSEQEQSLLINAAAPYSLVHARSNDLQKEDWGEAPLVKNFYGREKELARLKQWIARDHCNVVAILGIGGVGKTSLA